MKRKSHILQRETCQDDAPHAFISGVETLEVITATLSAVAAVETRNCIPSLCSAPFC